eukprot:TRINITY_DN515_c0_g4_i1.p1 TRINITY_DN515_c0_g4~~TRINITY_DN515_c0_g4_i1.p1  ORF type:complete len:698 (+),score=278.06 TRINITY_DN515_c0_g4_i1:42-2135(+)
MTQMKAPLLLVACCAAAVHAQQLRVYNEVGAAISPDLFSMFFETEINFGGEGGLYAEMIRNRDLEALGRGWVGDTEDIDDAAVAERRRRASMTREELREYIHSIPRAEPGLDPNEPAAIPNDFRPYTAVAQANLSIAQDAPFPTNPHSLQIIAKAANDGASNPGYWGVSLEGGASYVMSVYVKSANVAGVTLRLVCPDQSDITSAVLPVTNAWQKVSATLAVPAGGWRQNCAAQITVSGPGTLLADHVSLIPSSAVEGLFRADLFQFLKDFAPPQVRLPGGLYLEGSGLRTRWQWKNSVGPREARSGHFNTIWDYWVTDGLGLPEMVKLCKLIGAKPLVAIYTGFSPYSNYAPLNESQVFADEAVELIEYCNGNASTEWGKKRIADGITDPVGLDRLEIGNEETLQGEDGYGGHYQLITKAVWAVHPEMTVIASGTLAIQGFPNRSTSCFPCIGGCGMQPQRCDGWDEHTYMVPEGMANLSTIYDNYPDPSFCETTEGKQCPDVSVLEYASRNTDGTMDALAAAADAVFLLGMERNSPYVRATSYAPLFANVRATRWVVNLINFNASHAYANPSYYLQRLLKEHTGEHLLRTEASGVVSGNTWNASASVTSNEFFIKAANFGSREVRPIVTLHGFSGLTVNTSALRIYSPEATAANTLDEPTKVVSEKAVLPPVQEGEFLLILQPYSTYVIRGSFSQ